MKQFSSIARKTRLHGRRSYAVLAPGIELEGFKVLQVQSRLKFENIFTACVEIRSPGIRVTCYSVDSQKNWSRTFTYR